MSEKTTSRREAAARRERVPSAGYTLLSLALGLLCAASLLWVAVNVHPDLAAVSGGGQSGTAAGVSARLSENTAERFGSYVNNDVRVNALEDISFVKRTYSIPESALVAPKPDAAKFGETDDPAVVQAVVDSAAELLDGQSLAWNPDIAFMPGSTIKYYCDETILVITWKEALGNSAVSFGEIKTAHGSQLRRAIANNSYGSDVQLYASEMAKSVNAVLALNGDFYAFRKMGITVYQRKLYRCDGRTLDTCFITSAGDLVFARRGELENEEQAERFIADNDVLFSLSFGPILVENGVLQDPESYSSYPIGEIKNIYSRSGIGQLGKLHYLVATLGEQGPYNTRAQLATFARYMYDKGCVSAYALDGGQTAVMIMNGTPFNRVDWDSERTMSDIVYFATAIDGAKEAER